MFVSALLSYLFSTLIIYYSATLVEAIVLVIEIDGEEGLLCPLCPREASWRCMVLYTCYVWCMVSCIGMYCSVRLMGRPFS